MSKFDEITTQYDYLFNKQYRVDTLGVHQGHVENEQFVTDKTVSKKPILPVAIMDNLDSAVQKIEIALWDQGRWKRIIANREKLTNSSKIITLADQGVPVGTDNARLMATYFNALLAEFDERLPRKPARSVMGWMDIDGKREFMPYTDSVIFDGDDQYGSVYRAIRRKGTLQEWVEYTEPLRACSIELRLLMAASFASPLIDIVGENPFVLHMWGGTGCGKSVAMRIAASVWGDPAPGKMTRTMNMTPNMTMELAAFLGSIPLCADELQTIKTRWNLNYDTLIMQITEGINRGRMKYDRIEETKSWNCSFLFNGEEPCVKQTSGGGATNRVIQVELKEKLFDDGNAVVNFYKHHFGVAGPEYIDALQSGLLDDPCELYKRYFSELIKQDTTDKQAGAMALLLTADKIAHELFFHNEEPTELDDVLPFIASTKQVDITERAYQYVCGVIAESSNNFDPDCSRTIWGKTEPTENAVYINKTVLNRIMNDAAYDFEACKKSWDRNGYIQRKKSGSSGFLHYVSLNGIPTYCIKLIMPRQTAQPELTDYNGDIPFKEE